MKSAIIQQVQEQNRELIMFLEVPFILLFLESVQFIIAIYVLV